VIFYICKTISIYFEFTLETNSGSFNFLADGSQTNAATHATPPVGSIGAMVLIH
jgi:hypothetical protein